MRTQNKKGRPESLGCQLDKYNVSPIKTSLPVSNSAAALLTAARQGGCAREPPPGAPGCQHPGNRGPWLPLLEQLSPFLWHVNKTFTPSHVSPPKKMTIKVFDFHLFFFTGRKTKNSIVSDFYLGEKKKERKKNPFGGFSLGAL